MQSYSAYNFKADTPLDRYKKSDLLFLVSVILLWGLGIFTLFFTSQYSGAKHFNDPLYYVKRQIICSGVGFVGFLLFSFLNMRFIKKILPVIVFVTIILCILTRVPGIGVEKNGAYRWIRMPFKFTFQPSDLVKFAMVLFLANMFDKQSKILNPEDKSVLPSVVGLFVFAAVVAIQKDLSTTAFILLLGLIMFIVSGAKLLWLLPASPLMAGAIALFIGLNEYRMNRLRGFFHPGEGTTTFNYQSIAAKKAICAGGLIGNGIGSGLYRIHSIPEVQSDYIFAGWAEAFGLIGVIIYFVILFIFAWRGFKIAKQSSNRFVSYASFGFTACIVVQSLLNIAVVCGAVPSTGIPLPFFSLGGSSIIVTLTMCGFIMNASRCDDIDDEYSANEKVNINEYLNVELGDI